MADTKISALTAVVTPATTDEFGVNQGGTSKRVTLAQVHGQTRKRTVGITVDGGGSVLTTGLKGFVEVPFSGTITEWKMVADLSGSCVMDVWVDSVPGTVPENADSITASAKPTLSAQQVARSSTLTGWTTAVDVNDLFGFEVESATTVTKVTLVLVIETTI